MTATQPETVSLTLDQAADAARSFERGLRARFFEREPEIRGLLLAMIARCNVLLLGPPGGAKTDLATTFAGGLGWSTFVRLMGRTTVPEEVFGPFSLRGLEGDRYERVTAGYLPEAQLCVMDEIFKANSAILNALLTALNERAFDQGPTRIAIPLEVCVGASNEYPSEDGLAAIYDRFLLRFWTGYLKSESSFEAMLLSSGAPVAPIDREVVEVLRAAAATVDVSRVISLVVTIRGELARDKGIVASDRRWRQALALVRASAVLDGRTVAAPRDLAVLADCLWDRHEQRDAILAVVTKHRSPALARVTEIHALAQAEIGKLPNLSTLKADEIGKAGNTIAELKKFLGEARAIAEGEDEKDPDVEETIGKIVALGAELREAINKSVTRATRG